MSSLKKVFPDWSPPEVFYKDANAPGANAPSELKELFPGIVFTEVIPNIQYKDQNENVYGKFEGLWKLIPKTKYLKEPTTG